MGKEALHAEDSQAIAEELQSSLGGSIRSSRSGDDSGLSPYPGRSSHVLTQWDLISMWASVKELEESGEPTHSAQVITTTGADSIASLLQGNERNYG